MAGKRPLFEGVRRGGQKSGKERQERQERQEKAGSAGNAAQARTRSIWKQQLIFVMGI